MELSTAQVKRLRAEGHRRKLKPVVIIGQNGLSENVGAEIDAALSHHELIKLRIPALAKADKRELNNLICARYRAVLIESIGNVIVIYRQNQDSDRYAAVIG